MGLPDAVLNLAFRRRTTTLPSPVQSEDGILALAKIQCDYVIHQSKETAHTRREGSSAFDLSRIGRHRKLTTRAEAVRRAAGEGPPFRLTR